ncbi:hypothetical protein MNEG_12840 [Monoraphidium neglectum]|uniref:DUF1995 domain-containing protein n=1 Tax=Monoraphidium neglectum TaxID=145388 RepID=A0A0D2J5H7_9CHLO|nr:hypothetical protein MNEG_12840 [Monoraphidium neglectum]KIY95122.1 hypothetical protein MNEG_12840 [Monoraphidium neglectum]|eukprot:XP_013894142.1 hypothetical protein MNEG_12840 [Monoraphidium neglectum]
MAGSFEMALAPVPSAAAQGSGGDGTAGGGGATSSSSSVLHPTVGGSLELASSRRPGPGFTGSYDWRGSLLMTPNPFAVWATAAAAAGAGGGSVQRRRGLLQQADPWTSSLVVPVQGPVAVNEWGAAPAPSSASSSSGGGSGSNVLIDKDGSIQLLGDDSATAPPADSPGPAAGGNSSAGGNSTTGRAGAAAPLAQRPKALSTRNLVVIIAASTAGLLALASCGVLAAKAAARRRRRRRDKEEAARLRLRNGQPAPDFQIPDPVAELGQPGGAAGSANGERRGSQGPAHAALPSSRGSEERRHSSSLSGSLFSSSGAKIVMLFGALGFGFHGHRGTLPGARYASTRRGLAARAAAEASESAATASGRMTYRPESYAELVSDAAAALLQGVNAGLKRMEVEFPPIPTNIDAYKGSSDLFIDSNVQLALAAAKKVAAAGKRVHVLVPDLGEYGRSYKIFRPAIEQIGGGVTLGHLKEALKGPDLLNSFQSIFVGGGAPDPAPAGEAADVFIVTNISCVELPMFETYVNEVAKGRPVVTW